MITAEDHDRIRDSIRTAEQRTCGEIVCILAQGSSAYIHVAALWAAGLALVVPWLLVFATQWSVQRILVCQLAVFVVALVVFSLEPIRMRLVPRSVQRARAHREAMEQFFARGMTRTKNRCGVMIFVSLNERYARIVADEGIAAKVRNEEWAAAVAALVDHMRRRDLANGFIAAIERCGAILAEKAPPTGEQDDLPDRLYVI